MSISVLLEMGLPPEAVLVEMYLSEEMAYLIRDNDKKFPASFDTVFASQGIEIVNTPFQAPQANAFAERWVRSVREECLDRFLIVNERHLRRVLQKYIAYYNQARSHQGTCQRFPISGPERITEGPIHSRNVLGVLFMTTTASPQPWFQAADSIFTGYRVVQRSDME